MAWTSLIGSGVSMLTQKDDNGNSMLNVMGRGQAASKGSSTDKGRFVADTFLGGGLGLFSGGGGGDEEIQLPSFYTDPIYTQSQDILFPFASDLLKGNIPDFYKAIGTPGSPEFDQMLNLTNRDTANAVNENLAKRGISRGGLGASVSAKAAADVNSKLRWEDFSRAMLGKQYLLGTGLDTMSGVRTAALNNQSQQNQFDLAEVGLGINAQELSDKENAATDSMWSQLMSSAIGSIGSIMGSQGSNSTAQGTANLLKSDYNLNSIDLSNLQGFNWRGAA